MFRGNYFVYPQGNYFKPAVEAVDESLLARGVGADGWARYEEEMYRLEKRRVLLREDEEILTIIIGFMETM